MGTKSRRRTRKTPERPEWNAEVAHALISTRAERALFYHSESAADGPVPELFEGYHDAGVRLTEALNKLEGLIDREARMDGGYWIRARSAAPGRRAYESKQRRNAIDQLLSEEPPADGPLA